MTMGMIVCRLPASLPVCLLLLAHGGSSRRSQPVVVTVKLFGSYSKQLELLDRRSGKHAASYVVKAPTYGLRGYRTGL
jgi:hypothetical protein